MMGWPEDYSGRPLERVTGWTDNDDRLPECQICGVITAGGFAHDEDCGAKARAYLGWALRELAEAGVTPPRSTVQALSRMSSQERRDAASMRLLTRPRRPKRMVDVCMIPACGCSGEAHA